MNIYNTATICPFNQQKCNTTTDGLTLDPDISERFAKSRDFDELQYLWSEWHRTTGRPIRPNYVTYVKMMNSIAVANEHPSAADMWKAAYEDEHFAEKIDRLWTEVEPLYDVMHTYMKYKLHEIYGEWVHGVGVENDFDGEIAYKKNRSFEQVIK